MAKRTKRGAVAHRAMETGMVVLCSVFAGLGLMKLRQRRRESQWDEQAAELFMQRVRGAAGAGK